MSFEIVEVWDNPTTAKVYLNPAHRSRAKGAVGFRMIDVGPDFPHGDPEYNYEYRLQVCDTKNCGLESDGELMWDQMRDGLVPFRDRK